MKDTDSKRTVLHSVVVFVELLLVVLFIFFEELIWEGIAKPVYESIHRLKIMQKIERLVVERFNRYIILILFVVLLVTVEAAGVYAGILFVGGHFVLGLTLYMMKIPVAAFTFWLFRISEAKLMRFRWFRFSYEWLMRRIDRIKSAEIYRRTMSRLKRLKERFKGYWRKLKSRFGGKEEGVWSRLKRLYRDIKRMVRKS